MSIELIIIGVLIAVNVVLLTKLVDLVAERDVLRDVLGWANGNLSNLELKNNKLMRENSDMRDALRERGVIVVGTIGEQDEKEGA